jgi:hypothetical protein
MIRLRVLAPLVGAAVLAGCTSAATPSHHHARGIEIHHPVRASPGRLAYDPPPAWARRLGQPETLLGWRHGVKVTITLARVIATSHAVTRLREHMHYWYAVHVRVRNVGTRPYYTGTGLGGAWLYDSSNGTYRPVWRTRVQIPGCPSSPWPVTLAPDATAAGCLVFAVLDGRQVVDLWLGGGRGNVPPRTAVWQLPAQAP